VSIIHIFRGCALALIATAAFTGCSPLRTLNAVSANGASHTSSLGISYGPLARQKLDAYMPAAAAPAQGWPLVVFFYGGSWNSGQRADYGFVGAALADRGVVTLVADYRLYPEVSYPTFLADSALALAYGLDKAKLLGADPNRVFVMGHSAGGYNAAMLALDPRWLAATGHSTHELAGWIGLSGPYDFLPTSDPQLQAIFHHPDYPVGSQPLSHTPADSPRAFLGAPPNDKVVSFTRSTSALATRLHAAGVSVTLKEYPRATHATLIGSFAWPLRWAGPVLSDVVSFIQTTPAIQDPDRQRRGDGQVNGADRRDRTFVVGPMAADLPLN
jgi:acetyl esterase/lipase